MVCGLGRCIPPHVQGHMLALTEDAVRTVRQSSGHLPMLSIPENLADFLRGEAGENSIRDH